MPFWLVMLYWAIGRFIESGFSLKGLFWGTSDNLASFPPPHHLELNTHLGENVIVSQSPRWSLCYLKILFNFQRNAKLISEPLGVP